MSQGFSLVLVLVCSVSCPPHRGPCSAVWQAADQPWRGPAVEKMLMSIMRGDHISSKVGIKMSLCTR